MSVTKKFIWKLLIFFHAVWWRFYISLAPSSELGRHTTQTLHTTIQQKYMIFFLSFISSLGKTIRPKNSVLNNLLFLFVHDHSTEVRSYSDSLIYSFLNCASVSFAVLPLYLLRYNHTLIFCILYSWKVMMRLMSKGGTQNPGFCYWLVSFNNIAINLSQYFTNKLNTSILYPCQHTWETLQLC